MKRSCHAITTWVTPVKGVIALLALVVVVALSSEETDASATNPVCCGGIFNWPPIFPTLPPSTPVPASTTPDVNGLPITVAKVGSPIWKPTDFQLFSAPADPFPTAFNHTIDLLLPVEGPGAPTYTPHAGPYEDELSTNAAAAGFVNKSVFPKSAITNNPNGVFLAYMMAPDPGVTGSSRDFASGPVIPNSLFPMTSHAEMWLNGALVETLQDGPLNARAADASFTGASHRAPVQAVWWPWANDPNAGPLGNHELRWTLRDVQGNGWNISAPFQVTPEPASLGLGAMAALGLFAARRGLRTAING
jgi:hypothetical protein